MEVPIQVTLAIQKALADSNTLFDNLDRARNVAAAIVLPAGLSAQLLDMAKAADNAALNLANVNTVLQAQAGYTATATSTAVNHSVVLNALAMNAQNAAAAQATLTQILAQMAMQSSNAASAQAQLAQAHALVAQAAGIAAQAQAAAAQSTAAANQASNGLSGQINSLTTRLVQAAVAYLSFRTAIRMGEDIIAAREEMDRLEIGLRSVAPSLSEAASAESFMIQETNRLGLSLNQTIPEFVKMSAAFTQSGMTFKQTEQVFTDLAVASKALGLSSATTGRILYDFQEMISLGTVQMRQLRQVMMQMPGGLEIAARAMGVTTQEFHKLVSEGLIEPTEFVQKFSAELANSFGKTLPEATDTLESHINRLKNSWTQLLAEFGKSPAFKAGTDTLRDMVDSVSILGKVNSVDQIQALFPDARPYGAPVTKNGFDANGNPTSETTHPDYSMMGGWFGTERKEDPNRPDLVETYRRMQQEQSDHDKMISDYADTQDGPGTPKQLDLTDKQQQAYQKLLDLQNQLNVEKLTGLDQEYAKIDRNTQKQIEAAQKELAALGPTIQQQKGLDPATIIAGIKAAADAQKTNLGDADQRKRDAKEATEATTDYLAVVKILNETKVKGLTDEERDLAAVNQHYQEQYSTLFRINQQMTVSEDAFDAIKHQRDVEIQQIKDKYSVSYTGEATLMDLERRRMELEAALVAIRESDPSGAKDAARIQKQIQTINQQIKNQLASGNASMVDGFEYGFQSVVDSWGTHAEKMANIGKTMANSVSSNMTDALTGLILQTKDVGTAFQEMSASIIADLVRVAVQELIVKEIISGVSSLASAWGGGGSTAPGGGANGTNSASLLTGAGHTGGVIGGDAFTPVRVGVSVFNNAPRFHTGGVVGDEVPIVARKGEVIFTPEQMKALSQGGGKQGRTQPPIQILNVTDPSMIDEHIASNPNLIMNVITRNQRAFKMALGIK